MNNVTSFLVVTAAIFAVITVLLVWMSHLESRQLGQDTESGPPPRAGQEPLLTTESGDTQRGSAPGNGVR